MTDYQTYQHRVTRYQWLLVKAALNDDTLTYNIVRLELASIRNR